MNNHSQSKVVWYESIHSRIRAFGLRYALFFFAAVSKQLLIAFLVYFAIAIICVHQGRTGWNNISRGGLLLLACVLLTFLIRELWGKEISVTPTAVRVSYAGWGGKQYNLNDYEAQLIDLRGVPVIQISLRNTSSIRAQITHSSATSSSIEDVLGVHEKGMADSIPRTG